MGSLNPTKTEHPWVETPLVESKALSRAAGCRIFLKLENLQPSGSFKSRGIGNLVLSYHNSRTRDARRTLHFYSSSGGNAGLACVTAATSLGHPSTVVVPNSTKPLMITKIRTAGATEVIQKGATWKEADTYLREEILAKLKNSPDVEGVYCPPFDDPRIWAGNATMVDEIADQLPGPGAPDAIVCSVGGGGLFNGVMEGLDKLGWSDVSVLAMETAGADSLSQSLAKGTHITLPGITSLATSLGAVRVSDRTYELAQRPNVKSVVLQDGEAAMGLWRLADDEKLLVELACGVSTAVCYDGRLKKLVPGLKGDSKVVVVVCGGSYITCEMVAEWRETFKEFAGTKDKGVPSTHTIPAN